MRKTIAKSLLWQSFFRYGAILIAVTVLVGAVLGSQNVALLVKESENLLSHSLVTSASWLDARLTEMNAISYHIIDNSLLYPYEIFRNGYTAARATTLLNSYRNANAYLSDIVLYYDANVTSSFQVNPKYFTTTGSFDAVSFWNYIHPIVAGKLAPGLILSMPQSASLLYPVEEMTKTGTRRYLLYLTPACKQPYHKNQRGLLMFFIEESVVHRGLAQTAEQYEGTFSVYDKKGQVVYRFGDGEEMQIPQPAADGIPVVISSHEGMQIALRTQEHGLTYVLSLPSNFSYAAANSAAATLLPFLALLLLLALWGAYLLLRPLFRPMKQLHDMLKPYSLQSDESLGGIVYSIREMEARHARLENIGNQRATLARLQFFHNLLQGTHADQPEIEAQMQLCDCDCRAERYVVLCGRLLQPSAVSGRILSLRAAAMHALVETGRTDEELRYAVPESSEKELIILCCLPADINIHEHVESLYQAARQILRDETGVELMCSCGGACTSLCDIASIYRQARMALAECFVRGGEHVLWPREDAAQESLDWYPAELEEALHNALTYAKTSQAIRVIEQIDEALRAQALPDFMTKSICLSLVHNLMRLETTLFQAIEDGGAYRELINGLEPRDATLGSFVAKLCAFCEAFCVRRAKSSGVAATQYMEHYRQIESYLKESFGDRTLTLSSVAERFHLSEGHLSRVFKACSGTSVMQYLDTIRMENAKKLLRETGISLDEILVRCGYVDKSNFIRKFRKLNNVTPIQFREMMKQA